MQDRTFRYESDPGSTACWEGLQRLFGAIRDGDERYGAGGCRTTLFEGGAGNKVANAHLVDVLRMFSVKYGTHEDTGPTPPWGASTRRWQGRASRSSTTDPSACGPAPDTATKRAWRRTIRLAYWSTTWR